MMQDIPRIPPYIAIWSLAKKRSRERICPSQREKSYYNSSLRFPGAQKAPGRTSSMKVIIIPHAGSPKAARKGSSIKGCKHGTAEGAWKEFILERTSQQQTTNESWTQQGSREAARRFMYPGNPILTRMKAFDDGRCIDQVSLAQIARDVGINRAQMDLARFVR